MAASRRSSAADDYPNRVIHIIVGYSTGGNVDVPARLFAPELQRILGDPVIIENHPGASGVPAAEMVAHMTPDGYTVLWGTSASHSVSVVAMAPLPFDPVKDFAPITLISEDPNVIVASHDFPAAIRSMRFSLMRKPIPARRSELPVPRHPDASPSN